MNGLEFREDDLHGIEVQALLAEHLAMVGLHSPPESVHAFGIESLRQPSVTFWSAWSGSALAGCGALQHLDSSHGELKSMRTSSSFLRQGVATAMVEFLVGRAHARGHRRLSLETGSMEAFAAARALYVGLGFEPCGPFSHYVEDENSVFMTREL